MCHQLLVVVCGAFKQLCTLTVGCSIQTTITSFMKWKSQLENKKQRSLEYLENKDSEGLEYVSCINVFVFYPGISYSFLICVNAEAKAALDISDSYYLFYFFYLQTYLLSFFVLIFLNAVSVSTAMRVVLPCFNVFKFLAVFMSMENIQPL